MNSKEELLKQNSHFQFHDSNIVLEASLWQEIHHSF